MKANNVTKQFFQISAFTVFTSTLGAITCNVLNETTPLHHSEVLSASVSLWCVVAFTMIADIDLRVCFNKLCKTTQKAKAVVKLTKTSKEVKHQIEVERDCGERIKRNHYALMFNICARCSNGGGSVCFAIKDGETAKEWLDREEANINSPILNVCGASYWRKTLQYLGLYDENESAISLVERLGKMKEQPIYKMYKDAYTYYR